MKYPKISKLLKVQRELRDATLYDLEKTVGVTASYLSQVENGNKLPSKKVLFLIAHFLDIHSEADNNFKENLITVYAEYKNLDKKELMQEFEKFIEDYLKEKFEPLNKRVEAVVSRKLAVKKGTLEVELLDKPYFDLEWLLKQRDYEVFYGSRYNIQGTKENNKDVMNLISYSRLNEEDLNIIHDLIEAYISNRYGKVYKTRKKIEEEALKATGHIEEGD